MLACISVSAVRNACWIILLKKKRKNKIISRPMSLWIIPTRIPTHQPKLSLYIFYYAGINKCKNYVRNVEKGTFSFSHICYCTILHNRTIAFAYNCICKKNTKIKKRNCYGKLNSKIQNIVVNFDVKFNDLNAILRFCFCFSLKPYQTL